MFKLIPNSVWQLLKEELEAKREDNRRLTEALARQNGATLSLQSPVIRGAVLPVEEIPASGWFDKKPFPK